MNLKKAQDIVFDPYKPAPRVSVGFYRPTESFKAQAEHIAVMNDATGGLLAITGSVTGDDECNILSLCEAVVYAGAFEMLDLIKRLATGKCTADFAEIEAKGVLESLRHKMDGLEPGGDVSREGLRNCVHHKLGLTKATLAT